MSEPEPPTGAVVVPVPADAVARAALTDRIARLSRVRHAHLVAVLEARTARTGTLDVVHARGEAADLPAVLGVRGRLTPAEAAGVGVDAAQALAALHAAGLVHGPLDAADIVLRSDGRPALRPRVVLPPEEWTPAEDVRSLARLVDALLGSHPAAPEDDRGPVADPAGAIRAALEPAVGADPRRRPEAGTLAAVLHSACEPAPVRLPDAATLAGAALAAGLRGRTADEPLLLHLEATPRRFRVVPAVGSIGPPPRDAVRRPPGGRSRGPGRRGSRPVRGRPGGLRPALAVAAVALAFGVMTGAALELRGPSAPSAALSHVAPIPSATGRPSSGGPALAAADVVEAAGGSATGTERAGAPRAQPAADLTRDRSDPAAAAAALTQRRLDLLAGTVRDVAAVDLDGSPAHDADTTLVAALTADGRRPVSPRATVIEARVLRATARSARVQVTYSLEAHEEQATDGKRAQVAASGPLAATLELAWTADGWRVAAVA